MNGRLRLYVCARVSLISMDPTLTYLRSFLTSVRSRCRSIRTSVAEAERAPARRPTNMGWPRSQPSGSTSMRSSDGATTSLAGMGYRPSRARCRQRARARSVSRGTGQLDRQRSRARARRRPLSVSVLAARCGRTAGSGRSARRRRRVRSDYAAVIPVAASRWAGRRPAHAGRSELRQRRGLGSCCPLRRGPPPSPG